MRAFSRTKVQFYWNNEKENDKNIQSYTEFMKRRF